MRNIHKEANENMFQNLKNLNNPDRVKIFRGIDLNLFIVFSTLYSQQGTTRAAEVLGVTQSAVSHSLSRLRSALNDELFIRRGSMMYPTPFSKSIIDDVHLALDKLSGGPLGLIDFDPLTSTREFSIATTPGMEIFLIPKLLEQLSNEAPGVTINSEHVSRNKIETLLKHGNLDFAISTDSPSSSEIQRSLLRKDKFVTIAHKDNPYIIDGLDQEAYLKACHITISSSHSGGGVEELELAQLGIKPKIIARCGTITSAIKAIQKTNYMLTLGRLKLEITGVSEDIVFYDFPFPLNYNMEGYLLWHESVEEDPANQWLRKKIKDILQDPNLK
jgi:DNA-binding transcriptional LysR family regulator